MSICKQFTDPEFSNVPPATLRFLIPRAAGAVYRRVSHRRWIQRWCRNRSALQGSAHVSHTGRRQRVGEKRRAGPKSTVPHADTSHNNMAEDMRKGDISFDETAGSSGAAAGSSAPAEAHAGSDDPCATELTEQALKQLNLASAGSRKGKPSSTGGTTANTRPTDVPDLPDGEVPEMSDLGPEPHPQPHVEGVNFTVPEEMPQGTPPPVPEGLPVVSLTDIDLMEQKKGMRGRRVKSRRGSTTASHASLPQIPENVEITPLHARTERSDSLRERVALSQTGVIRLAEVREQDLEVDSKEVASGSTSRPTHADSPRSSSSALTSENDIVMPHTLAAHDYELHMPLMANPRAYYRFPNATEAYRGHRLAVSQQSIALSSAVSSHSDGGHVEQVLTDDSGLQLTGSTVVLNGMTTVELSADDLKLADMVEKTDEKVSLKDVPEIAQGTLQQETIRFKLPQAVEGLRCTKKYAVGELSWEQTVIMGDYEAGEHEYSFVEGSVPVGMLNLGQYRMKTVFMDAHGQYLWAGMHNFKVTKPE